MVDASVAQSGAEREAIWRAREDSDAIDSVSDHSLSYDIGLQLADLTGFANRLTERCAALSEGLVPYIFGHIGDGNLHVMFAVTADGFAQRHRYDDLIYNTLAEFPGSTISAEHGVGVEKRRYLQQALPQTTLSAMADLKRAFDPNNILNPCKIFRL